jgi:hypothetical protein
MAFSRKPTAQSSRGQKTYSRRPLTTYYRSKDQTELASPFKKKPAGRGGRKILFGAVDILLVVLLLSGLVYSLLLSPQPKLKVDNLSSVRVELPFFSQKPVVWLNISKPAFKLTSGGSSFVVDSAGVAVAKTQDLPKLGGLVSLNDQSGFLAGLGKQVLASQAVDFINSVIAQSKHANVPISSLSLPQAIAVGLSKTRREGGKAPEKGS